MKRSALAFSVLLMASTVHAGPISQLPAAGPFDGSEVIVGNQGATNARTVRFTPAALAQFTVGTLPGVQVVSPCNSVADDTGAIQAAANVSGAVKLPQGSCTLTSAIVAHTITLNGPSSGLDTSLTLASPTQDGVDITSDASVTFSGLTVLCPNSTAGTAISVTGLATNNLYSRYRDLNVADCFNGVATGAAALWHMNSVDITGIYNAGVVVANTYNFDTGDSSISDSLFNLAPNVNSVGILQNSSGGLKVANSKFLGEGPNYGSGYEMYLANGIPTSDLLIANSSFENMSNGLFFTRVGTNYFDNIAVSNVQFANVNYAVNIPTFGSRFLNNIAFTGDIIENLTSGGVGYGLGASTAVAITGGTVSGSGGPCTGVYAATGATGYAILYNTCSTPWVIPSTFLAINLANGMFASTGPVSAPSVETPPVAFSALPTGRPDGARAMVNNTSVCTFMAAVNGSGSSECPVVRVSGAWVAG